MIEEQRFEDVEITDLHLLKRFMPKLHVQVYTVDLYKRSTIHYIHILIQCNPEEDGFNFEFVSSQEVLFI